MSLKTEKEFDSRGGNQDLYTIQEILSCHFLLSTHDLRTSNRYIQHFFWNNEVENNMPKISLTAALRLLRSQIIFFVPYMLQAHMLILASRCTSVQRHKDCEASDEEMIGACTLAFELSIDHYIKYTSELNIFDNPRDGSGQSCLWDNKLSFLACIQPATSNRLNSMTDLLVELGISSANQGVLFGTKEDIVSNSYAYIKENDYILDEKFRDDIYLIMKWIVVKIISVVGHDMVHEMSSNIQQEEYCLAAAIKLMNSSLLQILLNLRRNGCPKSGNHVTCEDFDLISHIVSFRKLGTNQLVKRILLDENGINFFRDKELKLMLVHFGSLLVWSFKRRLGFLWNGCLLLMMILVNFLVLRKGSLDEFMSAICLQKQFGDFPYSPKELPKAFVVRRTSKVIASKFQNIQMLYLRDHAIVLANEEPRVATREFQSVEVQCLPSNMSPSSIFSKDARKTCLSELETSNGESSIQPLSGYHKSDLDDLVDFIECKSGKDYSSWLKSRKTFRKWQHQRRYLNKKRKKRK